MINHVCTSLWMCLAASLPPDTFAKVRSTTTSQKSMYQGVCWTSNTCMSITPLCWCVQCVASTHTVNAAVQRLFLINTNRTRLGVFENEPCEHQKHVMATQQQANTFAAEMVRARTATIATQTSIVNEWHRRHQPLPVHCKYSNESFWRKKKRKFNDFNFHNVGHQVTAWRQSRSNFHGKITNSNQKLIRSWKFSHWINSTNRLLKLNMF